MAPEVRTSVRAWRVCVASMRYGTRRIGWVAPVAEHTVDLRVRVCVCAHARACMRTNSWASTSGAEHSRDVRAYTRMRACTHARTHAHVAAVYERCRDRQDRCRRCHVAVCSCRRPAGQSQACAYCHVMYLRARACAYHTHPSEHADGATLAEHDDSNACTAPSAG